MAEWELVESRLISGRGVLRIPASASKNRAYILYSDVVRDAKNKYLSNDWNPAKSRYANLAFVRKSYVIYSTGIEYPQQAFDGINDISGQTLLAVKCTYRAVLGSLFNLSVALAQTPGGQGLQPISITDTIQDFESLRLAWEEVRVKCYADTALQLRLYSLDYDTCDEELVKEKEPPAPPPPPPPVPPGTPVTPSFPYDEETDNNNTVPFPGDVPVPPTGGNACTAYVVVVEWKNQDNQTVQEQRPFWGKIGRVRRVTSGYNEVATIELFCQGIFGQPCGALRWVRFTGTNTPTDLNAPFIVTYYPL